MTIISFSRNFYCVTPVAPFGDYGHILVHGAFVSDPAWDSEVLHRAGPDVPPITMPGYSRVIVTPAALGVLEPLNILADLRRVDRPYWARVDWKKHCRTGRLPNSWRDRFKDYSLSEFPQCDPESDVPDLYEIELEIGAAAHPIRGSVLLRRTWTGADLFFVGKDVVRKFVVTEQGRSILEENALVDQLEFSTIEMV